MHLGLIIDDARLRREHALVNRLVVGLLGEGIAVTRILPDTMVSYAVDASEARVALTDRIETPLHVLPWQRGRRVQRVLDTMGRRLPDVLYAMGRGAWNVGIDLARGLSVPLAIDVWSMDDAQHLPRGRASEPIAAYFGPTRPLARALARRVDPGLVCDVPVGIAVPSAPNVVLREPERSVAIAVIGSGRDVVAYRALLGGLSRVVRDHAGVHVFLELAGPNEHEIWRTARQLELLESISTITDAATHRSLLLRCDLMLLPEHYGEVQTIVLEAMSAGVPIVSARDPVLDMLEDGVTAQIVESPEADAWARQVNRLLTEPEAARTLGRAGRERIATRHRSSEHVRELAETLERVVRGGTFAFDPSLPAEG